MCACLFVWNPKSINEEYVIWKQVKHGPNAQGDSSVLLIGQFGKQSLSEVSDKALTTVLSTQ